MIDFYKTIAEPASGEFKDKGSKFIAFAHPINDADEVPIISDKLRKEHIKARHFCYAWRLGVRNDAFRANDDGEPSGTAGKPILGQIDSFGVTNIAIIVVRYFGGTLLGTSGLIRAYREAAKTALMQAIIIEKFIEDTVSLKFDYTVMPQVMQAVKKENIVITQQIFENDCALLLKIRQSETEMKLLRLKAHIGNISLEEAATKKFSEWGIEVSPLS